MDIKQEYGRRFFSGATMRLADLRKADLRGADMAFADLRSANLSFADLSHANLRCSDFSRATLIGTNLTGAHLDDANLSYANLRGAIREEGIIGPAGFVALGTPNGWFSWAYSTDAGIIRVEVGCRRFMLAEGRAYWAGKADRGEILAALDYAEAVLIARA